MKRIRALLSWRWAGILLLLLLLAVLPFRPGRAEYDYFIFILMYMMLLAVFAMGFNLLFGYTGLLSFGHAGFYAIGAYVCAKILVTMERPSLLAGVIPGILAAGLAALIIGYLCVRSTRIYFAMLTLSFGMMIWAVIYSWDRVTGGDDGLWGVPRAPLEIPGLFSIDMSALERYYYFVLIICILAIWFMYRLVHSPLGLTLQGIRDSESRVAFTGVSVWKYRLISFTVSGLYAGVAGSLAAPLTGALTPRVAHWTFSAEPVLASLLGGIHTFAGPIVGTFMLYYIQDYIMGISTTVNLPWRGELVLGEYWPLVFGIIVVVLTMGFRGGVVSALQDQLLPWLRRRFGWEVAS
jgi:branched-chain amino acid transport system permease protein